MVKKIKKGKSSIVKRIIKADKKASESGAKQLRKILKKHKIIK